MRLPHSVERRAGTWRLVISFVISAVLAAQGLALAHGIAHAGFVGKASGTCIAGSGAHATVDPDGCAAVDREHEDAADLFGKHSSNRDCQLFDQLAHADAVWGGSSTPPSLPVASIAPSWPGSQIDVYQLLAFSARAPPAFC